jgi:translocation and assembly module TamB
MLVALLLLTVAWIVGTTSGTGFALARAQALLGGKLAVEGHGGTLAGPLTLRGLRWSDPDNGIDVAVREARVDVALRSLLTGRVSVVDARIEGLRLLLSEPRVPKPEEPDTPFTLQSPIDVLVRRFELRDARVERDGNPLLVVDSAVLSADWIGRDVTLRQFDVLASDGEVHLAGRVREDGRYTGDAAGRFRWQVGERRFAGTLDARADATQARTTLTLREPLPATLVFDVDQGATAGDDRRWTYTLDVPRFDPRESLLPDSQWKALAAQLAGSGTLAAGETQGHVEIDGTRIELARLKYARRNTDWDLDALVALGRGSLAATGIVHAGAEPVDAALDLRWRDLDLPAALVGQDLRSEGRLHVEGSAERYTAAGDLRLGPPRRLADIQVKLAGTPGRIDLQDLTVRQPDGRLAARGTIDLPRDATESAPAAVLRWDLSAEARRFNPGEILADWPGRLDFTLATDGRLADAGPDARLVIRDLAGTLRGRPLAGSSDLRLAADRTLTGALDLRSGGSRVRLRGEQDSRGSARAVLDLDVANLGDWLPDARGRIDADLTATGRWPELDIAGTASAADVAYAEYRLASAKLDANVARPLAPRGRLELAVTGVEGGGFVADTLRVAAEGDASRHHVEVRTTGPDLAAGIDIDGALDGSDWTGQLTRLDLAVPDVAKLALQQAVTLAYSPRGASLSEACLADGDIRLCVTGSTTADGRVDGRYSVKALPLQLAMRLAAPDSPVGLTGLLDGDGDVRRDAAGRFDGNAQLRIPAARVEQRLSDDDARTLLAVTDFALDATLAGTDGSAKLSARLDEGGRLAGDVTATGLGTASTPLDGRLSVSLPSLALLEALAPQLTEVRGQLVVDATIGGTLDAPQPGGEARVEGFAAQVPELGLKLREGRIALRPDGAERFSIDGGITSGTGALRVTGSATPAPSFDLRIEGDDFLAADIPGVRAEVTPRLTLRRDAEALVASGEVRLPKAAINLQRLPSTTRTREASPDVVIVDDVATAERERAVPMRADVAVILGEDVKVAGYGLDAKVEGRLAIRERSGGATLASGEIRVSGGYKAYGQDLTIRQGQLLYAATPVDDPRLAIVAVREIDTVTAGLRVAGTARRPEITVFSEPVMGQSNALSYLIAGKPLDQVGQSEGEGDALQNAARQLGTAAGGLLAKNIGRRLGVDEVGIQDSAALGGAALTVGQYLSPRLFLSYGFGLFEPGNVLTLRYKLSKELGLEAEQATRSSRAGVQLRLER